MLTSLQKKEPGPTLKRSSLGRRSPKLRQPALRSRVVKHNPPGMGGAGQGLANRDRHQKADWTRRDQAASRVKAARKLRLLSPVLGRALFLAARRASRRRADMERETALERLISAHFEAKRLRRPSEMPN